MSEIYYSFCLKLLTFIFQLALIIGYLRKKKGTSFLIGFVRKLDKEIGLLGGSIGFHLDSVSLIHENHNNCHYLIWKH